MPRREPVHGELEIVANSSSITEARRKLNAGFETIKYWIDEYGVEVGSGLNGYDNGSSVQREPLTKGSMPPQNYWQLPDHVSLDSGIWSVLENLQHELKMIDHEDDEIDIEIKDDKPILLTWMADMHIGHTGTDMTKLRSDLETVKNTEGMYTILGGDLIDNVTATVSGRGMSMEQLAPIRVQKTLIEDAVAYLGKANVLAMILGNHEAWSVSNDDFDPIQYLARKIGCSYLGAFGFVNIKLQSQIYRILAGHQFRMRSSFNVTHQAKRMEDFIGDADVVFTGHTHQAGTETTNRRQQLKFYGQAGSYMTAGSRYSKGLGFPKTYPQMPGVILFPDSHDVIGVYDSFKHGPTMLKGFRAAHQ